MSKKTLWVLAIVLAALCAAVWWNGKRAAPAAASAAGGRLLPGADLATVRAVALETAAATTRLAQADGVWCVAEKDDYPVDLRRLRNLIQALDDADDAQVVDTGADRLAEFGLAAEGEEAPLRIALELAAGTTTVSLGKTRAPRRGEEFWGPPAGRYARVDQGPVLLLKDDVPGADADPAQWWDRALLEIEPEAVRKVEVAGEGESVAVERGTNGTFALVGAAEGEEVDASAAERLFGALRNLRADEILKPEESEGMFGAAATYAAETAGATYRIEIGSAQADRGNGRPVRIEATGDVPAATAKKLAGRAFLVPPYLADALVAKREALVRKAEAAPAESAPESATAMAAEPPAEEPGAEGVPAVEEEAAPLPEPPPIPDEEVPAAETPKKKRSRKTAD
ncbi:MAG TPA: DUF4340 domain-containing protein [Kiritimatiellia bacterium]|nr:DUF4340 domain-containing protein [Kiritimatiellia bacterium]